MTPTGTSAERALVSALLLAAIAFGALLAAVYFADTINQMSAIAGVASVVGASSGWRVHSRYVRFRLSRALGKLAAAQRAAATSAAGKHHKPEGE